MREGGGKQNKTKESCETNFKRENVHEQRAAQEIWSSNHALALKQNFKELKIFVITLWMTLRESKLGQCTQNNLPKNISAVEGKCKFEGSPKNGYTPNGNFPNGKLFPHGGNIEYACYAPYIMDGTNILHCKDGFWNASIPSCKGMYPFCANTKLASKLLVSPWKS